MTKYVSKERLEEAVENLRVFSRLVRWQPLQHILPLLAMIRRGVNATDETNFEEEHDFEFWNRYFTVDEGSTDGKYYDPLRGTRRIATHPHSNVATARKSTFSRSWHAADFNSEDGETFWRLSPDYLDTVREKSLSKGGSTHRIPALDLIAFLRRHDAFPDNASTTDLVDRFKSEFRLDDAIFEALFEVSPEADSHFFSDTPLSVEDVLGIVGDVPSTETSTSGGAVPDSSFGFTSLGDDLSLPSGVVEQAGTALAVGSHLILAGPPGTGKSTLAEVLASKATSNGYASGYTTATATADWTTFDTIGGYMPTGEGNELVFYEGLLLRSIRDDGWCIIDELNRANIDRAIGALITLLAGSDTSAIVDLPYHHTVGENSEQRDVPVRIRRDVSQERSGMDPDSGDYVIGRNWRLIATMNTLDRSNLFPLTAAFARRFATVFVGVPPASEVLDTLSVQPGPAHKVFTTIMSEGEGQWINPRPLGPAVAKDAWRYVQRRTSGTIGQASSLSEREAVVEALVLYVLPQYSGLDPVDLQPLRDRIAAAAADDALPADREGIERRVRERLERALRGIQGD